MRRTVNSISQYSREAPVKEDSIIEFLLNSEIEFDTCPKAKDKVLNFNTGFGESNDLHFETKCKLPDLKVPLYLENYLTEFKTEEEKAAARHALGIYNKGDVVAMSLLTAEDDPPSSLNWLEVTIKQLRKGDKFFAPYTLIKAVYDSNGTSLDTHLNNINSLIKLQQKEIASINAVTTGDTITSLGDVRLFLEGFNNGDNLRNTLDEMDQEMLRFEKTGLISEDNIIY